MRLNLAGGVIAALVLLALIFAFIDPHALWRLEPWLSLRRSLDFRMGRTRRQRLAQTPLNQNPDENQARPDAGGDNQNECDRKEAHRLIVPGKQILKKLRCKE